MKSTSVLLLGAKRSGWQEWSGFGGVAVEKFYASDGTGRSREVLPDIKEMEARTFYSGHRRTPGHGGLSGANAKPKGEFGDKVDPTKAADAVGVITEYDDAIWRSFTTMPSPSAKRRKGSGRSMTTRQNMKALTKEYSFITR